MKKLEFAKVQEGENKLAIEMSNDSPVVAVISHNEMLECILVNNEFPEVLSDICSHISSELGVVAVVLDTDQYGDDVTPIVVDSDHVKVKNGRNWRCASICSFQHSEHLHEISNHPNVIIMNGVLISIMRGIDSVFHL